ncbi:hypothetical protein phiP47_019 [Plesiomonas phage phiP4-7]|nr:hypothetical protein phiP47_019 [Plesiomonas phage phiP4-7]
MRVQNWQTKLVEKLQDPIYRTWRRGTADCALFVADCCVAVSGKDPAAEYRGAYDSALGAKKALLKFGSYEAALSRHFAEIDPRMAQRGDAVTFTLDGIKTVGILWAGKVATLTEDQGLILIDVKPDRAWRVE